MFLRRAKVIFSEPCATEISQTRTLKPPSLSAVTSAPTPPQFRPCRHKRRTLELLRRRRPFCRRDFLRLGQIFAAFDFPVIVIALGTHALPASVVARGVLWHRALGPSANISLSRACRCARIGIWLSFESRTDCLGLDGSWIEVPDTSKSQALDLIRRRRAVTTTSSSEPLAQPDHVLAGPGGSQAAASSSSSVVQPLSARRRHRPATTTDTTSTDSTGASGAPPAKRNTRGPCRQLKTAKDTRVTNSRIGIGYDERHRAAPMADLHSSLAHDIGHIIRTHCPMQWKSWKVMPDEIKMQVRGQLSTNYHLEDLNEEILSYVNRLFGERYKQWKSDLHHHFQAFDDPQVALQEGCSKELEGWEDSWAWLCAHFQAPDYVNKSQVNKGNRKKKTLLHHSGSRPFSYRMDARRRGGSKFPEIDVFGDVYVRPGNELAESLHTTMVERSQLVLQESASQLPPENPIESVDPPHDAGFQILTQTLDQTLGRRLGTYCRGMGNARQREPRPRSSSQANSQVTVLTSQVAELEGQMSVILQSLAQSGIPIPNFGASTSEPVHP
ncbi:unnamed protein product [Prunus armeniaca]